MLVGWRGIGRGGTMCGEMMRGGRGGRGELSHRGFGSGIGESSEEGIVGMEKVGG